MSPLRLAWLSLTRRKVPTLIALTSIALAVATGGLLLRVEALSDSRFRTMAAGGDALVGAKSGNIEILLGALNGEGAYPEFLPGRLYDTLRTEESLHFEGGAQVSTKLARAMIPLLYFGKIGAFRVLGTEENFVHRPDPQDSLSFAQGHWPKSAGEIALGDAVARATGLHVGDRIHVDAWYFADVAAGSGTDFAVSGVFAPTRTSWDRLAYTGLGDAQKALAMRPLEGHSVWGANVVQYLLVYMNPGAGPAFRDLINKRSVGQFVTVNDAKRELRDLVGAGETLGLWLTGFVLLLGVLSVIGVLATRFDAMAGQVAILRALGKSRGFVSAWVLGESLILGMAAVVSGAVLDALAFPLVRQLLERSLPSSEIVSIPFWTSAPVWIIALLAAIGAGFLPLLRIYQREIHAILKDGG